MSITGNSSPSLSPESYQLVELPSGEGSDDGGNDIVLSPRTAHDSHVSMQSDADDNSGIDLEEQDFVLVPPGSSVLGTSSVTSPVLQKKESFVPKDASPDTTLNDDAPIAVSHDFGRSFIDPAHSEGSAKYSVFSEDTSTTATPAPASPPSQTVLEMNGEECQHRNQEAPGSFPRPSVTSVKAGNPKPKPEPSAKAKKRREQRKRATARKAALRNATNKPTQPSPLGQINQPKKNNSEETKKNAKASETGKGGDRGKVESSMKQSKKAKANPTQPSPSGQINQSKKESEEKKKNVKASEAGKGGDGGKVAKAKVKAKVKAQKQSRATSVPPKPNLPLDEESNEFYEEAVKHMDRLISQPLEEWTTSERLAAAQALLVELGVAPNSDSVPKTVKAARRMLASSVHLNILDYLALRHKGLAALRNAMHNSRKALRKDLQNRKRRASRSTVKVLGLRDLLMQIY